MARREDALIAYLCRKGCIEGEDIVSGGISVLQVPGQKPIYRILTAKHAFIVKQLDSFTDDKIAGLQREYLFLQAAVSFADFKTVKAHLPGVILYDPQEHILVTRYLPYDTGLVFLRRTAANPRILGQIAGSFLAAVHAIDFQKFRRSNLLRPCFPYLLNPGNIDVHGFGLEKAGHLLDIVHSDHALCDALARLGRLWEQSSLIHCDVKLDNLLVDTNRRAASGSRTRRHHLFVIDWATASIGDRAWDIATLIQASMTFWLRSISTKGHATIAEAAQKSVLAWDVPLQFSSSVLRNYTTRNMSRNEKKNFFLKVIGLAGASLLANEISDPDIGTKMTAHQVMAMQLGRNLVVNPEHLYGEAGLRP